LVLEIAGSTARICVVASKDSFFLGKKAIFGDLLAGTLQA
jgi:hypothetical protein